MNYIYFKISDFLIRGRSINDRPIEESSFGGMKYSTIRSARCGGKLEKELRDRRVSMAVKSGSFYRNAK